MAQRAFLLLGSNLGNRLKHLQTAGEKVAKLAGKVIRHSAVYETASWGKEDQPAFLNQALEIETKLKPLDLLDILKGIEVEMGRKQVERWGARIIDIDILLMDSNVFNAPTLRIPHRHMHERRFTLVPLAEIAPDAVHPLFQETISELLAKCPDKLEVKKYKVSGKKMSA